MAFLGLDMLRAEIGGCTAARRLARVGGVGGGVLIVKGGTGWKIGDRVRLVGGAGIGGEVVALAEGEATVLTDGPADGVALGHGVEHFGAAGIAPDESWIGRVVDPFGQPLDGLPILRGAHDRPLRSAPPAAAAMARRWLATSSWTCLARAMASR